MSFMRLAFSSDAVRRLSSLPVGTHATVVEVRESTVGQSDRLAALGVTLGALVTVMQTFPGVVFLCDQTELAVEHSVASAIFVRPLEKMS